ncbi:MAG: hypothetical protein ABIP81_05745 [Terriglobales bacterium]
MKKADSFNAVHFASAIKLAFFVASDDPVEAERVATRQRVERQLTRLAVYRFAGRWAGTPSSIPRRLMSSSTSGQ